MQQMVIISLGALKVEMETLTFLATELMLRI